MSIDHKYLNLIKKICLEGCEVTPSEDRTGTGYKIIPSASIEYDMSEGFPLIGLKFTAFKTMSTELEGFLKGITNKKWYEDRKCMIWSNWTAPKAYHQSDLGTIYSASYRRIYKPSNENVWVPRKRVEFDNEKHFIPNSIVHTVENFDKDSYQEIRKDLADLMYNTWVNVIDTAYHHKVPVDKRWFSFKGFVETVSDVIGFYEYLNDETEASLSREYFDSNVFSPETCVFLPRNGGEKYIQKNPKLENGLILRPRLFIDQIQDLINLLKKDSASRRGEVVAWYPPYLSNAALPPCHDSYVVSVINNKVNLTFRMRSNDVMLGLPFNIASYALLLSLIAKELGADVGILTAHLSNVHIYNNHLDGARELMIRAYSSEPRFKPSKVKLNISNEFTSIAEGGFSRDHVSIENYNYLPAIKLPVAV